MAIPGQISGILTRRGDGPVAKPAKLPQEEKERASVETRPSRAGLKKFDYSTLHKPQGPDSGINAVIGKWPGDETDEQIQALLEELS
jgi:hypothetical protein